MFLPLLTDLPSRRLPNIHDPPGLHKKENIIKDAICKQIPQKLNF